MRLEDTCFEIVQANEFRDTPEGVKSAFMTADEAFNVLVPDHFFVGMARVGKDQFEEPGPMVAAIFLSRCTLFRSRPVLLLQQRCGYGQRASGSWLSAF